jgi:hypothetical protein
LDAAWGLDRLVNAVAPTERGKECEDDSAEGLTVIVAMRHRWVVTDIPTAAEDVVMSLISGKRDMARTGK